MGHLVLYLGLNFQRNMEQTYDNPLRGQQYICHGGRTIYGLVRLLRSDIAWIVIDLFSLYMLKWKGQ